MRDEFVDTCGLCDAPLRMGQRCACGDNWRAAQPAPAQSAALARKCRRPDGCDDEWRCSMNTPETAPCGARMGPVDLAQPASAEPAGPVAWREHVEQRIRSWRQSTLTRSGDRLAIDDYMGADDIDDLVDYVCDERADPAAPSALHEAVDILRKLLSHYWSEDCQECAIGQSSAWADAKALIARVDAARRDGGE